jgi:hypothetical protein
MLVHTSAISGTYESVAEVRKSATHMQLLTVQLEFCTSATLRAQKQKFLISKFLCNKVFILRSLQ